MASSGLFACFFVLEEVLLAVVLMKYLFLFGGHRMTATKPCYQVSVTSHRAVCNAHQKQKFGIANLTGNVRCCAFARHRAIA